MSEALAEYPQRLVEAIARCCRLETAEHHHAVYAAGDEPTRWFIVLSGEKGPRAGVKDVGLGL